MREIKFRGLSFRKNKFVYGDYFTDLEEELPYIRTIINDSGNLNESPSTYQKDEHVKHETVGQYTGLKDSKYQEIYEGDVVKWDDQSDGKYWRVAIVKIDPDLYFHCFDCPQISNSSSHGHKFHYGNFIYKDTENHLEIIGNIHESPELLETR